jgi:hypothetical protein
MVVIDAANMQQTEFPPGGSAPETGVYEELNVFGTPTGNVIVLARTETFPVLPMGFTWRPLSSLSAAEIRDRAAHCRAMAGTASTEDVRDALLKLAVRFDKLASERENSELS